MKRFASLCSTVSALLCFGAAAATAQADEGAIAGRKILSRYQDAVLTVRCVLRVSYNGRDSQHETKVETTGTMVNAAGLTVISLSSIDPTKALSDLLRQRSRSGEMKLESEVSEIKLLLADGSEVAAEVALREDDLDLAYVRPTEKLPRPIEPVDLANAETPAVLDQVVVINRLGKVASRVPAASVGRIEAVVEKPRPFYALGSTTWSQALGSPVFGFDGKCIGIVLLRTSRNQDDSSAAALGRSFMTIIVPAADVLAGAKEAMESRKPATEPAKKGEPKTP